MVGPEIFKNIKTVIKAFKLVDVNKTGLVQPCELRRVLETFCVKMKDDEYKKQVNEHIIWKIKRSPGRINKPKIPKRKCFPNSVSSEEVWKNCSLDEIERTFCHELLKSYEKVGKALSAGDPSKSGYISLNYLKFVLDTFVYRLPRRIFIRLMKRLGLKTTTKVKWKQFLTSLYEPQWLEVNNKIPLTKRNRQEKSPARGSETRFRITSRNQSHKEDIITKLFRYEDHYTSLKKELLVNTKPDGQIRGEEL
ncbi:EF-hand calcium-binding domain-containing protein 6 [Manis javanica]|nr:EF-hand calcium-binding domain-containing protein 6 [Manis javanica]